jgi:hypothetical protein
MPNASIDINTLITTLHSSVQNSLRETLSECHVLGMTERPYTPLNDESLGIHFDKGLHFDFLFEQHHTGIFEILATGVHVVQLSAILKTTGSSAAKMKVYDGCLKTLESLYGSITDDQYLGENFVIFGDDPTVAYIRLMGSKLDQVIIRTGNRKFV